MGIDAGVWATAVGGLASSYAQSEAIREQGRFERDSARMNARLAQMQAADAARRGGAEELARRRHTKQLIGEQRLAGAAQGISPDVGSAAELRAEASAIGALDELAIRSNAFREAWGHRVQALDARTQGRMASIAARGAARQTLLGGFIGAGTKLSAGYRQPPGGMIVTPPAGKRMSDVRDR